MSASSCSGFTWSVDRGYTRGQAVDISRELHLDNRTVAFRTDAGTKLDWASMGPVAFEIDMTDAIYHEGWSVVVLGTGRDITEGLDDWSERVSSHVLTPWAGGAKDHWVAIASPVFSGRKIVQTEEEAEPTA